MGKDGRWKWAGGTETEMEEEVRDRGKKSNRRWWKAEEDSEIQGRWKVKDDKKTMKGCRRMRRTGQVLRKRKNRRCWGAERDWGQQELEENEGA